MTKHEAHIVLNQVREGINYPQSVILKALVTTGDIDVRCFELGSAAISRTTDSPYTHSVRVLLPSVEG